MITALEQPDVRPSVRPRPTHPFYHRIVPPFDMRRFSQEVSLPLHLGACRPGLFDEKTGRLAASVPNVDGMLIKRAGSYEVVMPARMYGVMPFVRHCMRIERTFADPRDMYMYLTVTEGWVEAGAHQRTGGFHVDGFEGERARQDAHKGSLLSHSYVVVSGASTTEVLAKPLFGLDALDDTVYNVFDAMDQQVDESRDCILTLCSRHLYLMDPYVVHRSPVQHVSGWRTFLRVEVSRRLYTSSHTTDNKYLDRPQDRQPEADIRQTLTRPDCYRARL